MAPRDIFVVVVFFFDLLLLGFLDLLRPDLVGCLVLFVEIIFLVPISELPVMSPFSS